MVDKPNDFDVIIVGGGLSGLMRADMLADDKSHNRRIAIVEPNPVSLTAKTFASWRHKNSKPHRYSDCIANRWDRFRIISNDHQTTIRDFEDYYYEHIPGQRLFDKIKQKIDNDSRFVWIKDSVCEIAENKSLFDSKKIAHVKTSSGQILSARHVLNSAVIKKPDVLQYFLGFELETSVDYFDPKMVDLMDFRLPQASEVRFVYILPFDARRALVEFTVFATDMLSQNECETILRDYITKQLTLPDYKVVKVESGVIPMALDPEPKFPPSHFDSAIESIGSAAGMVKASTGYSFQRNLKSLATTKPASYRSFRFRIYDALLLHIIKNNGGKVSTIFHYLFSSNRASKIFSFLDETSNLKDELRIFLSLPSLPFLWSLICTYPFIFAVLACLSIGSVTNGIAAWIIPAVGLLTMGIGHGSIDHLLSPQKIRPLRFYGLYLGSIALFISVWLLSPPLALGYFIFQAADHFGEAEWIRALRNSGYKIWARTLAWFWGLFAATFGVFMHWGEARPIIELILGDSISINGVSDQFARSCGIFVVVMALVAARIFDRYERRALGQAVIGVPSTLMLAAAILALPLLPGFLCFFAFWHSHDSIKVQRATLKLGLKEYVGKSLRYTVLAIISLATLLLAYGKPGDFNTLWQIIFLLIGALTAAHAPVMKKFLKTRPETNP